MSADCHEEHEQINAKLDTSVAKLDTLEATLEYHTAEVHGELVSRSEIEQRDREIDDTLRDALLGPKIEEGLHAGQRRREEGIEYKVNQLWSQAQNGGINARLRPQDRALIVSAIATGLLGMIGVIAAAIIGVI